jgi:hypothetical protein
VLKRLSSRAGFDQLVATWGYVERVFFEAQRIDHNMSKKIMLLSRLFSALRRKLTN